jgi:hypothetical protein
MGTHCGAVRHDAFHVRIITEVGKQGIKDTMITPASIAFVDAIPFAILCWQEPPLRTTSKYPEDAFDEAAALVFITDVDARLVAQELDYLLPLVIW